MRVRLARSLAPAFVLAVMCGSVSIAAQWIKYPTAGVPRLPDGKPNLSAPTPRMADGKPDFSGMWFTDDALPCPPASGNAFLECGVELGLSRYGLNIGQVEQQLAGNNVNAGGSFVEAGLQQVNVRVPDGISPGSRALVLSVNGTQANTVEVQVTSGP